MGKKIQEQIKWLEFRLDEFELEMKNLLTEVRYFSHNGDAYKNADYILTRAYKLNEATKRAVGCREKISMLRSLIGECDKEDTSGRG